MDMNNEVAFFIKTFLQQYFAVQLNIEQLKEDHLVMLKMLISFNTPKVYQ